MISPGLNDEFARRLVGERFPLELAVQVIRENLNPEQVFEQGDLVDAACETDEVFTESHWRTYARETLDPADIFTTEQLLEWFAHQLSALQSQANPKKEEE